MKPFQPNNRVPVSVRPVDRPLGQPFLDGRRTYRACARCGIVRQWNNAKSKPDNLCIDCRSVEPRFGLVQYGSEPIS